MNGWLPRPPMHLPVDRPAAVGADADPGERGHPDELRQVGRGWWRPRPSVSSTFQPEARSDLQLDQQLGLPQGEPDRLACGAVTPYALTPNQAIGSPRSSVSIDQQVAAALVAVGDQHPGVPGGQPEAMR